MVDINNGSWWAYLPDYTHSENVWAEGARSWRKSEAGMVAYVEARETVPTFYRWRVYYRGALLAEGRADMPNGGRLYASEALDWLAHRIRTLVQTIAIEGRF